jgi:hypothetical protein
VKKGLKFKTGAAALALSMVAGNAAQAMCANQQEMTALRASALRQHLMVAALTCHETEYFNQFVTEYRAAYQDSDRELLRFFAREGSGDEGYNAYKTKEANDSSLRSMHEASFCGDAEAAFYTALHGNLSLEELAKQEAPLVHTGYLGCERSADAMPIEQGIMRTAASDDQSARALPAVAYAHEAPANRWMTAAVDYR